MNIFFKKHSNIVLNISAIFLFAFVIFYTIWGVESFTMDVGKALVPSEAVNAVPSYNIQSAGKIDLRGLVGH